jgi:hypothetical protein
MGLKTGLSIALVAAVLMAALAAGCGGGSSSSSGSTSSADSTSSSSTTGASAEFTGAGPNGKIVKFGQEADTAEREAASSVLEENLKAREAGDWAKQCTSLSAGAIKKLEQEAVRLKAGEKCAESLEYGAEPQSATKAIRANTMTGPIAVLRVEGNKAFALYHGTKGKDYAMQMEKEGGEWKVASLITTELH